MNDVARASCRIDHPKSKARSLHFVAFGVADQRLTLTGTLTGQGDPVQQTGDTIYRKSNRDNTKEFWSMRFQVNRTGRYTLHISAGSSEVAHSDFEVVQTFEDVVITYPQAANDNPIPLEFVAYGTAGPGVAVTGVMSSCDPTTDIEQDDAAPDWSLYCYIVNPNPPCTLTVSQAGSNPATSAGLQF